MPYTKQQARIARDTAKRAGYCYKCLNPKQKPAEGKLACQYCIDRQISYYRVSTAKRIAQGLCKLCGKSKPAKNSTWCLDCQIKRADVKDKHGQRCAHHGISKAEFRTLFEKQNGNCAICGTFHGYKLCVDHSHVTSEVRGLLCQNCNKALGLLKDDITVLKQAVTYLRRFSG